MIAFRALAIVARPYNAWGLGLLGVMAFCFVVRTSEATSPAWPAAWLVLS